MEGVSTPASYLAFPSFRLYIICTLGTKAPGNEHSSSAVLLDIKGKLLCCSLQSEIMSMYRLGQGASHVIERIDRRCKQSA